MTNNVIPVERVNNRHPVPLDQKAAILDDAIGRIDRETLEQIAQSHGITKRTLNTWLMGLDGYTELRQAVIDSQLAEAMEAIDTASDTFPLARAREQFRSRAWIAERRDARYAAKQEAIAPVQATSSLSPDRISELLDIMQAGIKARNERTIEHDPD